MGQPPLVPSRRLRVVRQAVDVPDPRHPLLGAVLVGGLTGLALLVAGLATWLYWPSAPAQPETVALVEGIVEVTATADAWVIRREVLHAAPVAGYVRRLADEGRRIRLGDPAVEISDSKPESPPSPALDQAALRRELDTLNAAVFRLAAEIRDARDHGEHSRADLMQAELDRLAERQVDLARRVAAMSPGEPVAPPGAPAARQVEAESAGILLFQTDGLAGALDPAAAALLTPGGLKRLPAPVPQRLGEVRAGAGDPVFAVVDNLSLGLVIALEAAALPSLPAEGLLQVRFPGRNWRPVTARVDRTEREAAEVLLLLSATGFPDELAAVRRIRVELVFSRYTGYLAPRTAVDVRDGRQGVWALGENGPAFHRVRVMGGNERLVAMETSLPLGTRIMLNPPRSLR